MGLKKNPKFDLKRKNQRFVQIGMIISLTIMILLFKFFPKPKPGENIIIHAQELLMVEDVEATKQETAPPPPPKPPIPIEAPTDDVLDDVEIESTEINFEEDVAPPPPPPPVVEEEAEPVFFVAVEQMPAPIGGIKGIQKKITYPELAKRAGVQGRVYVLAYVDEEGIVEKVELTKGIGAGCDEEAMRAVKSTLFIPGKQRDKPVKVRITVPVLFKLK